MVLFRHGLCGDWEEMLKEEPPFVDPLTFSRVDFRRSVMAYIGKYTRIPSGYMGQIAEWPEVITEGTTIDECRSMLRDALQEMILAYREMGKPIPSGFDLFEPVLFFKKIIFSDKFQTFKL